MLQERRGVCAKRRRRRSDTHACMPTAVGTEALVPIVSSAAAEVEASKVITERHNVLKEHTTTRNMTSRSSS
ncbi:hypothetical protein ACOMHN_020709 [Nucella lapillus]